MFTKEKVFDSVILRTKCDDKSIYQNETFLKNIDLLLGTEYRVSPQGKGKSQTSVYNESIFTPDKLPIDFDGAEKLKLWLIKCVPVALELLSDYKYDRPITIHRNWVNKKYFNSSIIPHHHGKMKNFFVAVFYINYPKDSGKLFFTKHRDETKHNIEDYDDEDVHVVNESEGELIVHKGDMIHGVTEHLNKNPRLSMIFEFCV